MATFVSKELSLVASNERCPSESYTLSFGVYYHSTELSYITRKAIMEICFRKMKLFQYTNSQATMKLCHKKWRVLLFILWLTKRELKVLLKATVQITSAVSFNPECPVPRDPAQEGSNSSPSPSEQLKCTRSALWPWGRGWVCHRTSNRNASALKTVVLVISLSWGPILHPGNIKKSRGPHTSDTAESPGVRLLALYCSWGKAL